MHAGELEPQTEAEPITVMLQYFVCEKPLRLCHFMANLGTLRSDLCDCGGSSTTLDYISANLGSVNISEVGMYIALSWPSVGWLASMHASHSRSLCELPPLRLQCPCGWARSQNIAKYSS